MTVGTGVERAVRGPGEPHGGSPRRAAGIAAQDYANTQHSPVLTNLEISIPGKFSNPAATLSQAALGAALRLAARAAVGAARRVAVSWSPGSAGRAIPDAAIRTDALGALARKRTHADGAALFWILPRARNRTCWATRRLPDRLDFLDNVNEREASLGETNGRQSPPRAESRRWIPTADRERLLPLPPRAATTGVIWRALVGACREGCERCRGTSRCARCAAARATRALVLGVNHDRDPLGAMRGSRGGRSGSARLPRGHLVRAYQCGECVVDGARDARIGRRAGGQRGRGSSCARCLLPVALGTGTMLDSYVDQRGDVVEGNHAYIEHYPAGEAGLRRVRELVDRSAWEARSLRKRPPARGDRRLHGRDVPLKGQRSRALDAESTRGLVQEGGALTVLLLPVLRMWRVVYAQRSA